MRFHHCHHSHRYYSSVSDAFDDDSTAAVVASLQRCFCYRIVISYNRTFDVSFQKLKPLRWHVSGNH